MRTSILRMAGAAVVLAATIASVSAFAHKPEQQGMGMMGEQMEAMGGMAHMMDMMTSMSVEDRSAMQAACMEMMQGHDQVSPDSTRQ
ncbi:MULTISPECIES: hypothetical protein [Marinobacter]|jgi:protein CpxP|uniref:hypothetical protein n=1 Tax=Marinobacter TaxID=2742 RepID=UPI00110994CB|nr:hypothetical protein [Marinobacter alexandrii]MCK2150529.1 hypothetical protein [Marinobacter alexandrii]